MGTTNLIGSRLFGVQIEHVGYDLYLCIVVSEFAYLLPFSIKIPLKYLKTYIYDLLSFTYLIIQHVQFIWVCD